MDGIASYVPVIGYVSEAVPSAEFRLVDIGCSGGIDPVWRGMGPRLRALAIDPNVSEIERLRSAETHPGIEYVAASATLPTDHPFAAKAASSSWWTRNPWDRLSVVKSLDLMKSLGQSLPPQLGAAVLSSDTEISDGSIVVLTFLRDHGIDSVDFLKIDVDGPDFDILNSFDEALGALNVLGLGIEVSYFGSASDTDRSFHNIDRFMKAQGFELFGMTQRRYSLAALPSRYLWSVPAESEFGRPTFGDAVYIRDLGNPEYAGFSERLSNAKFLNLICIFAAFNLPDCAADVALQFRDRLTTLCNVDRLLDLLAAQAQGPVEKPLSYSEYLRRFDSNSSMFFDAKVEHANRSQPDEPKSESATGRPSQEFAQLDLAALSRLRALGWTPRVIFDVGASNGSWSHAITQVYPDAQYHLFEPLAAHVPDYQQPLSTLLEQRPTFTLHPVALGDRVGEIVAYRFPNAFASTTLPLEQTEPDVRAIRVPVTTLDELVGAHGVPRPNLLKVDAQGSEFAILQGAEGILASIDVLLLETWLWRTYEGKTPLLLEIASWLAGRGFFLWDLADPYRDPADVLASVDCFFVNAQSMAPYLTYRTYRALVDNVETGDRARLVAEVAQLRADLQRATQEVAFLQSQMEAMERKKVGS